MVARGALAASLACALVFGAGAPGEEKCVFLLATPGSGSTSMARLLNAVPSCELSGENSGALHYLARFRENVDVADAQRRSADAGHDAEAWRGVYNSTDVRRAEVSLVRALLNPTGRRCWGFKEIRFGRGEKVATFARDVAYLRSLCARPRVIIHTQRAFASEHDSSVIRARMSTRDEGSREQWACFETFFGNASAAAALNLREARAAEVSRGCAPPSAGVAGRGNQRPIAFRHTLEDYLEDNEQHDALFHYIGVKKPARQEPIRIRTSWKAAPA